MKKQLLVIILLQVLLVMELTAQCEKPVVKDSINGKGIVFYINQPSGFISKVRLSVEMKLNNSFSFLTNYTNFYGLSPGQQGFLETRYYINPKFFTSMKIGMGNSFEVNGYYAFVGAGFGQIIYLDKNRRFSFVCIQGIKVCPIIEGEHDTAGSGLKGLFFLIGPGAIIDLNFNLGFRL